MLTRMTYGNFWKLSIKVEFQNQAELYKFPLQRLILNLFVNVHASFLFQVYLKIVT